MSAKRGSKRRKTRSGCSGIELVSAFHVLQNFRDKIKTEDLFDPDDNNLDSVELEVEIDKDALTQLDDVLQWMDLKIKAAKKVSPWLLVSCKCLTSGLEPRVLIRQLKPREQHSDYRGATTFSQRQCNSTHCHCEIDWHRSFHVLQQHAQVLEHAPASHRETCTY